MSDPSTPLPRRKKTSGSLKTGGLNDGGTEAAYFGIRLKTVTPKVSTGSLKIPTSFRSLIKAPDSSSTPLRKVTTKTHVQQLEFITFYEPSEMRDRHNRKLAHVHSVKENERRLRFQSKQRLENFKIYTGDPNRGREGTDQKPRTKSRQESSKRSTSSSDSQTVPWTQPTRGTEIHLENLKETTEDGEPSLTYIDRPSSILSAGRRDPFGTLPINSGRIDFLMDSYALRPALEPLFSVDNDGLRSLSAVFPEVFRLGLSDPAFFHVLLLAVAFTLNANQMTSECLAYKAEAIKRLNDRLLCEQRATSETSIGTIMILTGVEYRMGNCQTHSIHMQGLHQILKLREGSGNPPREGIKRALFWQDLNGSVISGSKRLFTHETFSELSWDRNLLELFMWPVPSGFVTHSGLLDGNLLSIVADIQALKASIELSQSCETEYLSIFEIDNVQASIESRLAMLQKTTQAMGPVAECCRLATYICSYVLFTEIWNSTLIPAQLSLYLRRLLLQTSTKPVWQAAPDVLLWVLFVGGAFAEPAATEDYVEMLRCCRLQGQLDWCSNTWEETETLLKTFIFVDKALLRPCQDLWKLVNG